MSTPTLSMFAAAPAATPRQLKALLAYLVAHPKGVSGIYLANHAFGTKGWLCKNLTRHSPKVGAILNRAMELEYVVSIPTPNGGHVYGVTDAGRVHLG